MLCMHVCVFKMLRACISIILLLLSVVLEKHAWWLKQTCTGKISKYKSKNAMNVVWSLLQQPEQQQTERHPWRGIWWSRWSFGAAANGEQADRIAGTHVQRPQWPENPVSIVHSSVYVCTCCVIRLTEISFES